ncbi:alpha-L-fucosidase [Treponema phagedenis]|nr:alpha-L-fucosidase [Treponema phagedenis]
MTKGECAMMQEWFKEAKLGIFIHWGIYAVKGVAESWSFYHGRIPYDEYMQQAEHFTASRYNPEDWAKLIKESESRYAVITTKHHDGFALWNTEVSDWNAVKASPAGRDLIAPWVQAIRNQNIKAGLYFSHLDWSHPDYASILREDERQRVQENPTAFVRNKFTHPMGEESPEAWQRFLRFHRAQLTELLERFQPDLLWFDGEWEKSGEQWRMREVRSLIHSICPHTVINGRMHGFGDYKTPEQAFPAQKLTEPWELCTTMNDSWGYQAGDTHYKSLEQIIQMFVECISLGGNLLLDIGPMEDGTIPQEQQDRLRGLGAWIRKNKEAIFGTGAGIGYQYFHGQSTVSKNRKKLYLFCFNASKLLFLKNIPNKVCTARLLSEDTPVHFERIGGSPTGEVPGLIWFTIGSGGKPVPQNAVLEIEFETPLGEEL